MEISRENCEFSFFIVENASPHGGKSSPKPFGRTPEPPCFIPTDPRGLFVYFYQIQKISKIFCENPLTILAFCAKIVNCIIIAFTMGNSAFRQVPKSKKGDFTRLSLCNLTNTKSERSIRLRPRHLPCPWVVRLAHEVPDVRADVFGGCAGHSSIYFPAYPAPAAAREFARRCHTTH